MSSHAMAPQQLVSTVYGNMRQDLIADNFDVVFEAIQRFVEGSTSVDRSSLFHHLVRGCTHVKQHLAAAWCAKAMVEFGFRDRFVFNLALDAGAKVGDLELAYKLWGEMVVSGIQPNAVTYNIMINACAQAREGPQAEDWVQRMASAGFPLGIVSYSSVIAAFAKVGDYAKAEEWYENASEAGIVADVMIYNSMIHACAQRGYSHRSMIWFAKMLAADIAADDTTYNSLINVSAKVGNVGRAEYWMNEMIRSRKTLSTVTFGSILHACARARNVDRAEYWMGMMIARQLTPNVVCFNAVLHACAQKGEYARALKWFRIMCSVGVRPDRLSYNFIIDAYSRAGELVSSEAWLNKMVAKGFFADKSCQSSLVRALRQFVVDQGCNPHLRAHYLIIKAYACAGKLDFIRRHVSHQMASMRHARDLGHCFREELMEMCLKAAGLRFALVVFKLLDVPIGACRTKNIASGALRECAGTKSNWLLQSKGETLGCYTCGSESTIENLSASEHELIARSTQSSELDQMMNVQDTTLNRSADEHTRVDSSDDDFYTSASFFSL